MKFELHIDAIEVIAHKVIDVFANVAKAVVTVACVAAKGAFRLGQMARKVYENDETTVAIKTCKALAESRVIEAPVTVLDSEYDVIVTPATEEIAEEPQTIDDYWNAQVEILDDKIDEIHQVNVMEQQLCLPAAQLNIDEVSYVKTGKGRCRKGYRKIGNRCVQIKHIDEFMTLV